MCKRLQRVTPPPNLDTLHDSDACDGASHSVHQVHVTCYTLRFCLHCTNIICLINQIPNTVLLVSMITLLLHAQAERVRFPDSTLFYRIYLLEDPVFIQSASFILLNSTSSIMLAQPHESSPLIINEIVNGKRISPMKKYSIVSSIDVMDDQFHESPSQWRKRHRARTFRKQETKSACGKLLHSLGGLFCLSASIILWVLMSEVIQSIEDTNYNKPFFLRWAVNSSYILSIIPWAITRLLHRFIPQKRTMSPADSVPFSLTWTKSINTSSSSGWTRSLSASRCSSAPKSPINHQRTDRTIITGVTEESPSGFDNVYNYNEVDLVIDHYECPNTKSKSKLTISKIVMIAVVMNMFNMFGCAIWYLSLTLTTASLNNTLYQSSCVFALLFSFLILNEQVTFQKIFACFVAMGGVTLVMFSVPHDTSADDSNSVLGIVLALLAAMCFSAWEVGFKYVGDKYFQSDRPLSDTLLFQSGVGLANLLLFWPLLMLMHYTGFETLELPSDWTETVSVLLPCLMDFSFTAFMLFGITMGGAVFMAMGMTLVVPFTFFADIIVFRKQSIDIINVYSIVGAAFVIFGFILIQKGHGRR